MHSGWGVLVAVSADPVEMLARRRIVTADPEIPGDHSALSLRSQPRTPGAGETHLALHSVLIRLAAAAIAELVTELNRRHYRIVGAAVLLASGRPLPALEKILAAHPLIHSAEGEFFRHAASKAFESLHIPVTAIRERDLDERAKAAFGNAASRMQGKISSLGSEIGPPWTKDHKTAALAAALILAAN